MKIIELLNKIANGEKVPNRIMFKNYEYMFRHDYDDYYNGYYRNVIKNNWIALTTDFPIIKLEDEVEIIEDKEIGQENNRESKVKQTSDEFTEETRYYTPEGEIYETTIKTYKCPKNYISKDKIREKIKELENDPDNIEEHNCLKSDTCYSINILEKLLEE